MKEIVNFKIGKICLIAGSICFSFLACTNDRVEEDEGLDFVDQDVLEETEVLKTLLSWGYEENDIIDRGNYYVVQGDIMFYKNVDYSKIFESTNKGYTKKGDKNEIDPYGQYYTGIKVANHQTNVIGVWRDVSLSASWKYATFKAMINWEEVCGIDFGWASSENSADIVVKYDGSLSSNTAGFGAYPYPGGIAGDTIVLNPDTVYENYTAKQKEYVMTHEFGHNIGFVHTNQPANFVHIYGTPTGNDNYSIMNGGTAGNSWSTFSHYDKIAAERIYPSPPPPLGMNPSSINLTSGNNVRVVDVVGVGAVSVTLTGDSGLLLSSGGSYTTSLNLTAPTNFEVYSSSPTGNKFTRVNLISNGSNVDITYVSH